MSEVVSLEGGPVIQRKPDEAVGSSAAILSVPFRVLHPLLRTLLRQLRQSCGSRIRFLKSIPLQSQ